MIKSKIKKTLIAGICFSVLSSGVAFANGGGSQPSVLPDQQPANILMIDQGQQDKLKEVPQNLLDTPVSNEMSEPDRIDSEIFEKQRKIDQYLFEEHTNEIEAQGFQVTHTGPCVDYVEIGITPYSEKNAEYLYNIFGQDKIKVVEGQQAQLYNTSMANKNQPLAADVEVDQVSISSEHNSPWVYALGGCMLLGGGIFTHRKLKKR